MTVTDLREQRANTESTLDGFIARVDEFLGGLGATVTLRAARQMANETGIHRFQDMLQDSVAVIEQARAAKRTAQAEVEAAKDAYDFAYGEATWMLGQHFEVRANKTWLARAADGRAIPEGEQRSLTADEKKDWVARYAERLPEVALAAKSLAAATERLARANDSVDIAEKNYSAAKALLDSARADLETVRIALTMPARPTTNGAAR